MVKRDITIEFQRWHTLAIKAGTRVEIMHGVVRSKYFVHPSNVTLLSDTRALFDHDSTYRFIWIDDEHLTECNMEIVDAPSTEAH
ncbi:hypothetical protein [Bradyrhizobium sp. SZCCHNS3053]|uniref:hypothetical protein n=1 Tax=Bradyrhizobium sp. SZCCHNS3053 TaxID=3057322 RepID=UPI002916208D|nr:hypothetical protein [Bradyrhizobium sp. SZCCHNS3053]